MRVAEHADVTAVLLSGERQCQKSVINFLQVTVGTEYLMAVESKDGTVPYKIRIAVGIAVAPYEYAGGLRRAGPSCDLGL